MNLFSRKTKRAAVLGCGPSGLFAAHALVEKGWDVVIFSKLRRSELFGAQYLHAPIPGLTDREPFTISYRLNGTADDYRAKVYPNSAPVTSVEVLEKEHAAWDIRTAYARAWDLYWRRIENIPNIGPGFLGGGSDVSAIRLNLFDFDWIVSSIPAPDLCHEGDLHKFDSQQVWAIGDAPERGVFCPIDVAPENTVLCDGTRDTGWYRAANVLGYRTAEWPERSRPPLPGVSPVTKPMGSNCTCWGTASGVKLLKVGRYGRWQKSVLSHQSYTQAAQL